MPETPSAPRADQRESVFQRSPSKLSGAFHVDARNGRKRANSNGVTTLTTAEKQQLLSRHLSSVEDLVKDLRNCAPFGGIVC